MMAAPRGLLRVARALMLCAVVIWLMEAGSRIQAAVPAGDPPREHLSLDANWKFHLGDDWPGALHLDKSGTGAGPAAASFGADTLWRSVNLPHDWGVELPFDKTADANHGFKPLGPGFKRTSIGWYRRTFELPAQDEGKRIWLTFDGVYRDATVWVNGWLVRRHESGYYPFREDITNVVHFGGPNVIAVRVDASKFEGWFYEGAGIYRHVWLDETGPVAIAPDGVFVHTLFPNNVPGPKAQVCIAAEVLDELYASAAAEVQEEILSPEGTAVAHATRPLEVGAHARATAELTTDVSSPELWSPESPRLYTLVTTVRVGGRVVDRLVTRFGVRTIGFDPAVGFLLNGKRYELHGTCNHQDHAGVGTAIPDALQDFRVKRLQSFGCNAIRTAHNPPTPELLDACDRLGMLVMDESRTLGSDSENLRRWSDQIRRDRNHPSVVMWSIGNEEFAVEDTPQAARVAQAMQERAKQLDPTRPVTYAAPEGNVFRGINSVIEVRGWNYHYGPDMDAYHTAHPGQPNVGTEQASVVGDRGIYANEWSRGLVSGYDVVWPGWTTTAESWWSYFADRPWLSGGFAWTGFDYRGEPTPYGWPCISSHFGILDTCGFPKDSAYYYQAWWTHQVVLHLAPHWNWPGKEGQEIRVEAESNCDEVELFLNGKSLGRKRMPPHSKLVWQVKYEPGTLSARGFDGAGKQIAEAKVETAGAPVRLQLVPDRTTIDADGMDVAVFTVSALDAEGRAVPVAENMVHFALDGAGRIIGVGNGDPTCHEPDTFVPAPPRTMAVNGWRWKVATLPMDKAEAAPEFASGLEDGTWALVKAGEMPLKEHQTAVYRAHVTLTPDDLKASRIYVHFRTIDDHGVILVNGQQVGKADWDPAESVFEIRRSLKAGDNVISVGVRNDGGPGGLDPDVALILADDSVPHWSRSLFNGLAQVIVQSTPRAGAFSLTASSDGLAPATAKVTTRPCLPRETVR